MEKLVGLFSGGKDSLVACHYLWRQKKLDEVLYCKTGIGLPENFEFVKETCKKFNWKLNVVEPKPSETYEHFVRRFGFPGKPMHGAILGFLKWHPMRKFARPYYPNLLLVSGRRQKESVKRFAKMKEQFEDIPDQKMRFYAPLFSWSDMDVINYIKEHKLEISPVYETLHLSGDCLCGSMSKLGESYLIATFHPELAARIKKLEEQYGGGWGNQCSVSGASRNEKLIPFLCADCISND